MSVRLGQQMTKIYNVFSNKEKKYNQLAEANSKAVYEYNRKTLSTLLSIACSLILLPLVASIFNEPMRRAIPVYVLTFLSFFVLFLLFHRPGEKKSILAGLYVSYTIFFLFGIYLSTVYSPHMNATILLGGFAILPLSIIDRPRRMIIFLLFWLVVHTVLAFIFKPQNAIADLLNCVCATALGCYLGISIMHFRLQSFETSRLLMIEKETDILTGLFNRRKLFDTLGILETTTSEKPTGILMIDIDHFKDYNDTYGHTAGDKLLKHYGELFSTFSRNFSIQFYRYGGEEFLAMAYNYGEKELMSIAESLRLTGENVDMSGRKVSVSIGVAFCGGIQVSNYESIIDRADKAVYAAKRAGRNKVCTDS